MTSSHRWLRAIVWQQGVGYLDCADVQFLGIAQRRDADGV